MVPNPGDYGEFDCHDNHRYDGRVVKTWNQKGERVSNPSKSRHCATNGATQPGLSSPAERAVVRQRSRFSDRVEIDGLPASEIGRIGAPDRPGWALTFDDLPTVIGGGER